MGGSRTVEGLNPQQQLFIQDYLIHGNGARAARTAGYSERNSAHQAAFMLKTPRIKKAIEEGQKASQARMSYGLDEAMREAEDCINFAKQTDNANAYAKAIELRMRLNGLIIDKHDVRSLGNFKLVIEGVRDPLPSLPSSSIPLESVLTHIALPLPTQDAKVLTTDQETDYSELFD